MLNDPTNAALVRAVMHLRAVDGMGWDNFMRALAQRVDEVTEKCIASSLEVLPTNQGRALEARDLFRKLAEAPQTAEAMRKREQAQHDGSK